MKRILIALHLLLLVGYAPAQSPDLIGGVEGRGLLFAESEKPVYRFNLQLTVDKKGDVSGTLTLDATPISLDEFGFPKHGDAVPPIKLDYTLKYVKKLNYKHGGINGRPLEKVELHLYDMTGPKITSKLTIVVDKNAGWKNARLLVADKDGKNRSAVHLYKQGVPEPCHPGCFPAGTLIQVEAGTKAIETLRVGDVVRTVDAEGKLGDGEVAGMFITDNRLWEVRTDGKTLITTETQPLSLSTGKLRAAGELKAGDQIHIWEKGERKTVTVKSVEKTERQTKVYNLVLGEPVLFIANGFLARSKPPAEKVEP